MSHTIEGAHYKLFMKPQMF